MRKLIEVRNLNIAYGGKAGWTNVVQGVCFEIARSEAFGLVGESGCGKSTVAYRLLGHGTIDSLVQTGEVMFDGTDLLQLDAGSLTRLRGNRIALVPQNPTTSLSPSMRVGSQIREMIATHRALPDGMSMANRIVELFALVGLPDVSHRYPHELSGGQQQRVAIAMAVACNPDLLVLDEPTTGLDVTTQRQIIQLLGDLRARIGMAMLYVTHDLALLAQIADRMGVMYAGQLVEVAPCDELLSAPAHPYSRGLIASIPTMDGTDRQPRGLRGLLRRDQMSTGCKFEPRCGFATGACRTTPQFLQPVGDTRSVACMKWQEAAVPQTPAAKARQDAKAAARGDRLLSIADLNLCYRKSSIFDRLFGKASPPVVREIDLELRAGEVVALVGESGSGKSTIARAISGRLPPQSGSISLDGSLLAPALGSRSLEQLRQIQYIFQNPDASLNPRRSIRAILERPLDHFGIKADKQTLEAVLENVGLHAGYLDRFPDQLSGGERQRIAIARALLVNPKLLICDEILSALDVSVQARIVELLRSLKEKHAVAMLFISHDLAVVQQFADRVAVLYRGELMQLADTDTLLNAPIHPYTEMLLEAAPGLSKDHYVSHPPAMPMSRAVPGVGCPLAGRCPRQVGDICAETRPPVRKTGNGFIRCHVPADRLAFHAGRPGQQPLAEAVPGRLRS
ncbi:ABC transporter ATP-binding protein [Mesorhizobium sp. VK23B]|uniref:ABC transporter ATP-binding protein n=1 Tax=Mesorhizobium dulcispinae TaxID=3072316 RepID=A0ABU4XBG6_9HYPH|nr:MULTISPECIES: ABC transporter ATP-binding protein [unclassified Mesorhizobium]MDX8465667.1 ABC transporter ATP-binding protein [Mesorhizobium sp. VK23B]MDX8471531.1 ABC transporter ATP-binding protein [Mesorhizobium sp. VK23A]